MKYIIARYNEDIGWSDGLDRFVVQKGEQLPNVGREPASYFWYILNFYDELEGEYTFCQGDPIFHEKDFLTNPKKYFGEWRTSSGNGSPDHTGLPIAQIAQYLGITEDTFRFKRGAQFSLTADEIRSHDKAFYLKLYAVSMMNNDMPYVLERLWPYIFPCLQ